VMLLMLPMTTIRMLAASSSCKFASNTKKPTVWIKGLRFAGHSPNNVKLRTASTIPCPEQLKRERENADKALSFNCGC
jgi:hypothetical protein